MRRTFRQLKDSERCKAGAIWHEQCDDGNQDFRMVDLSNLTYNYQGYTTYLTAARDAVLKQPEWFEEVFTLESEALYFTSDEILKIKKLILIGIK